MSTTISEKEIVIQYQTSNGEVACATVNISETGVITCGYDSLSNAENSISTGTPVLALLAQTTGIAYWDNNIGEYVINPALSTSNDSCELTSSFIKAINNVKNWFAIITTQQRYGDLIIN